MSFDVVRQAKRQVFNFTTAADLTGNQFRAVRIFDSLTVGSVAAAANPILGIQENVPLSGTGAAVTVCTGGITIAEAGAAFTAGADLSINASGQVIERNTTTNIRVGTAAKSAGAVNQQVSVLVNIDNSALPA